MKNLKANLMMVVALVIGVVTMSFRLANNSEANSSVATHWYVKNPSSGIYEPKPGPPAECLEDETEELCALAFAQPRTNVTDADEPSSIDQRYREE